MAESPRVIVGMSGGVDSSVSALLLLQQGYRVEGLFMKNWDEDDGTEYCTAREDLADAQRVCDRLGIALHTANFAAEYWDRVFEHFLAEYQAGRTPNPDILCNKEIKFRAFLDYARVLGADFIATGHYARRGERNGLGTLLKGLDANKDQSYFLHAVGGAQLAQTLFPVGELEKSEVRRLAREHQFDNATKKDSTGICFIGERRFSDFLARYLPREPGPIETPEGQRLGEHQGLAYYTIGQRGGLGIGGVRGGREAPWFVAAKDVARNTLILVQETDHPLLMADGLTTERPHWIAGAPPATPPFRCRARLRHRQPLQDCEVVRLDADGCIVRFDQRQRAVTPGQSIVFYRADECLGGAVIRGAAHQ